MLSATMQRLFIESTLINEGGSTYTDIPGDRGGSTRYGVTQATLSDWLKRPATKDDVRNLSKDTAIAIYSQKYLLGPGLDKLPISPQIVENIFDHGINSGPSVAIRLLQEILQRKGEQIKNDGVAGPATYSAARKVESEIGSEKLNDLYVDARLEFYQRLVASRPDNKKFANGWRNRALKYRTRNRSFTPYTEEPEIKPLSRSKTIVGAVTAAVGTIGTQAAELGSQATQGAAALQPHIATSSILKFVFIFLTIAGLGLTIYSRIQQRNNGIA